MTEPNSENPRKGPQRDVATIADLVAALRPADDDEGGEVDEALRAELLGDSEESEVPAEPVEEADEASNGVTAPARTDGVSLSDTLPMAEEDDLSKVRGTASPRLVSIVESLLFAAERPMGVRGIRKILKDPTVRQVQLALKALRKHCEGRGVVLGQVAGGFRMRTNPDNARYVQRMLAGRPARLSRMQLETLAIVAYRQPITKAEIDHVRGVDCGAVIKLLLERNLARIVGRKEEPGRPHLYGTTVEFLEFFNLMSLRDMPDLHEFRELTDDSRAQLREHYGDAADEVEAEVLGQERLFEDADEAAEDDAPPSADEDAASEDAASEDAASEDIANEDVANEDAANEDAANEEVANEDVANEDAASEDVTDTDVPPGGPQQGE